MIDWVEWNRLRMGHTLKEKIAVDFFYYDPTSGNGDWAYNTCREIVDRGDRDAWSHKALEGVFETLDNGKRWPDYAIPYIDLSLHHEQFRMTQDPWILAYCCAVHLDRKDLIERYKPNFWLFLPDKRAWRRALLGKTNLYWLWRRITPYRWMQHFVYVFYGYMELAYIKKDVSL